MTMNTKVVITGISGCIGHILYENLKDRWTISGIDIRESRDLPVIIADINDYDGLLNAFKDAYAVIHLAANANARASWDDIVAPNISGTQTVFKTANNAGVKKVIFASSNHVTGLYEQDEPYRSIVAGQYKGINPSDISQIDHRVPIRPDGYYGISKAFGEALGRYYSEKFDMQVICLRIGTVSRDNRPRSFREHATLFMHRDLVTLIDKCLMDQNIKFEIFYGVSSNKWKFWDTAHISDHLGWAPEENAESFRT